MSSTFSIAVRSPAIWLALLIAVLCISLQFAGLAETWRFDRQDIASGAWYLLLTGNFVHLGAGHLWMNMAGFALIVVLYWQHFSLSEWAVIVLLSSVSVGMALFFRDPAIGWYVGFSGTLHGLIIAGGLADLKHYPKYAILVLSLVIGKLIWEQFFGALPGSEEVAGGSVVVNSHLYGAIAGALIALALLAIRRLRYTPP